MATAKQITPHALVEAAKQLSDAELDKLINTLHSVQAYRKTHILDVDETALLATINGGLAPDVRRRYRELIKRRRQNSLTEDEHTELLKLTELAEQYQVERLEALIELAQIRNMSLDEVMASLGIVPPPVE